MKAFGIKNQSDNYKPSMFLKPIFINRVQGVGGKLPGKKKRSTKVNTFNNRIYLKEKILAQTENSV